MQMAQGGERPRITRRRGACKSCRQKKSRCTGDQPCSLCKRRNVACIYEPPEAPTSSVNSPPRATSHLAAFPSHLPTTPVPSNLESIDWFLESASTPAPFSLTLGDPVEGGTAHGSRSLSESDPEVAEQTINDEKYPPFDHDTAPIPIEAVEAIEQDPEELNPEGACFSLPDHVSGTNSSDYPTCYISSVSESIPVDKAKGSLFLNDETIARHKRLLFPALHRDKCAPQYNPSVSALTSRVNQSSLDSLGKQTVTRTVGGLLSQDHQTSLPAAWADLSLGQPQCGSSLLSIEILRSCIARCFEDPWGVRLFLDGSDVLSLTEGMFVFDARHGASGSLVDRYLLNTLVATSMLLRHDHDPGQLCDQLLIAVEMEAGVLAEVDSLQKLFALVATVHLYNRLGLGRLPQLLASVVSLIRSMSLHSDQAFSGLGSRNQQDMDRAKRACWLVFCIDNEYALRWKTFSMLQESVITYNLPEPVRRDSDTAHDGKPNWLEIRCRYGQICAQICGCRPATDTTADLVTKLEDWYTSLPSEFRIHHKSAATTSYARHITIALLYRYQEARQAILETTSQTPLSPSLMLSPVTDTPRPIASMSSIKQVFEAAYKIEDVLYDRSFLYMPTICLCKLVVECITGSLVDGREARTLLAMAHGFFGRISSLLPTEGYFDHVTELIGIVSKSWL